MPHSNPDTENPDNRALHILRRRARYLTGNTRIGNALASTTSKIMSGDLPRQNPKEPRSVQLIRALHNLYPELSDNLDLLASAAQSLEVIERCSKMQVRDILDLNQADEQLLYALRKRRIPTKNHRILLIEDEALLAMDMCHVITENGNSIVGVSRTRAEAIEAAIRIEPDIIVSDLALADGSSGAEAVSAIETCHKRIPVVILSGTPELVLTDNSDEPTYVLGKPHEPEQLQLMMALALRSEDKLPSFGGRAGTCEEPDD